MNFSFGLRIHKAAKYAPVVFSFDYKKGVCIVISKTTWLFVFEHKDKT